MCQGKKKNEAKSGAKILLIQRKEGRGKGVEGGRERKTEGGKGVAAMLSEVSS